MATGGDARAGADNLATSGGGLTTSTSHANTTGIGALRSLRARLPHQRHRFFRRGANRNDVNGSVSGAAGPVEGFRRMQVGFYTAHDWNDDRLRLYRLADIYGSLTFRNFWTLNSEWPRVSGLRRSRYAGRPAHSRAGAAVRLRLSRQRQPQSWRINLNVTRRWDDVEGWTNQIGPSVSFSRRRVSGGDQHQLQRGRTSRSGSPTPT